MRSGRNMFLVAAAICSALAALAHLGCIIFGADWYRFFGAGEEMARMAEAGDWYPIVVTTGIVAILLVWSLYALSGAGIITRLPFVRLALCAIASILLIRGVAFVALMPMFPGNSVIFWFVSSAICLIMGILYSVGTYQAWPLLNTKNS